MRSLFNLSEEPKHPKFWITSQNMQYENQIIIKIRRVTFLVPFPRFPAVNSSITSKYQTWRVSGIKNEKKMGETEEIGRSWKTRIYNREVVRPLMFSGKMEIRALNEITDLSSSKLVVMFSIRDFFLFFFYFTNKTLQVVYYRIEYRAVS